MADVMNKQKTKPKAPPKTPAQRQMARDIKLKQQGFKPRIVYATPQEHEVIKDLLKFTRSPNFDKDHLSFLKNQD